MTHPALWGLFSLTDRNGITCCVSPPITQGDKPRVNVVVVAGPNDYHHLAARNETEDTEYVRPFGSDNGISDEELMLVLWGRVEAFVAAQARSTTQDSVGVVIAVPSPAHVHFLRHAVSHLVLRHHHAPQTPLRSVSIFFPASCTAPQLLTQLLKWQDDLVERQHAAFVSNGSAGQLTTISISSTATTTSVVTLTPATPDDHVATDDAVSPSVDTRSVLPTTTLMTNEFLGQVVSMVASSPSRVALVTGPTGCGKSTKVPIALIDASPQHTVWVAQPRRVAAVSLCRRIEVERGSTRDAAYVIGGSRSDDAAGGDLTSTARILFMTSGVLLQRVKAAFRDGTHLKDTAVTHIILDEVHERTVEYDLLLCMLREVLRYNASLRLVLTSATMSSKGLQLYMAQRCLLPQAQFPPTLQFMAAPTVSLGAMSPLSPLRQRHIAAMAATPPSQGSSNATVHQSVDDLVPVVSFHTTARQRRTVYIEDVFQTVADAAANITRDVRGVVTDPAPNSPDAVFHNPSPQTTTAATASYTRPSGKDAIAYLKLPFSLSSLLHKPSHKESLVWEARFSLTAWLVRILHYTRPTEEAILVFLSGIQQLEAMETELLHNMGCTQMHILLLHSSNDAENKALFDPPPSGCRKVLIATNIAESSLTIPDVDHVIDTCVVKDQRYLHDEDLSVLEERYCSKDSCEQRAGRTGRVRHGSVWRMISKAEYTTLDEGRVPGITQTPLTSTMLLAADANVGELDPFLAALPTPPPLQGVVTALTQLTEHYRALASVQLRGSHVTLLQPTLKGVVLSALGLPVAIGELVLAGVMCGIPVAAAQAGAIIASSAPLLTDDGGRLVAHLDHGTGCDVVASVELLRWWTRVSDITTEATPQHSDAVGGGSEDTLASAAVVKDVFRTVRPHIMQEVRIKARDIMRTLAGFGLAMPSLLHAKRLGRWEAAEDVAPLAPRALIMLIAAVTMAFPHRTAAGNDIHAKHASRGKRNLYTPSHRVQLVLRGVASASDEDRVREFVAPASCTTRLVGENRISVNIAVERVVDVFHNVPDYYSFMVRNVRNISWDAYRLIKATRAERRELSVAYTDSGDDVHLLSSWFTESKAPIFIDRGSVVYPLAFDASVPHPPTVVACHAVRRDNRVAYLSNLLLPGSLSVLPVVLAPLLHWDGRSIDERQCLSIPSLPHCHPSPKRLKQKSADLFRLVAALRDTLSGSFDRVLGYYGSQEYMDAVHVASSPEDPAILHRFLMPAYQRLDKITRRVDEDLGLLMCVFLDQVPKYYAPRHVALFVASRAHQLPADVAALPFVADACALSRQGITTALIGSLDDAADVSSEPPAPAAASPGDGELPPTGVNGSPRSLIDRRRVRSTLHIHQLFQYHRHQLTVRGQGHILPTLTVHGGLTPSAPTATNDGNSGNNQEKSISSWAHQLCVPRCFAKTIPQDATASIIGRQFITSIAGEPSAPSPTGGTAPIGLIDVTADASGGLFAFFAAVAASELLVPLRRVILRSGASWTKEMLGQNMHLLARHKYSNIGTITQWHTTQNTGGLPPPSAASAPAATPTRWIRMVYIPPSGLQATQRDALAGEGNGPVGNTLSDATDMELHAIQELHESIVRGGANVPTSHVVAVIIAGEREGVFLGELKKRFTITSTQELTVCIDHVVEAPIALLTIALSLLPS